MAPPKDDEQGDKLIHMQSQFAGLPMKDLIGGPLQASCDAQTLLATATYNFITDIGMEGKDPDMNAVTVDFSFKRPGIDPETKKAINEQVDLNVPLLAIVNTPNLSIKEAEVKFTMSVHSSSTDVSSKDKKAALEAGAKFGWGPFSAHVDIHGSIASHSSNTRESDNSAKYDVKVLARDDGPPEGLMKVLDMLGTAIAPLPEKPNNPPAPN